MVEEKEINDKVIVKERRGFYIHFIIYLIVNIGLFIQWWYITGGEGFPWVVSTTGGWGIGIIAHFLSVFVLKKK
jgi:hypothetical protein